MKSNIFFLDYILSHLHLPTGSRVKLKVLLLSLLPLILAAFPLEAGQGHTKHTKIVSVQSMEIKPYQEVLWGFEEICQVSAQPLVISQLKGQDLFQAIEQIDPSLILAIGPEAFSQVKTIRQKPIIYLMVLNLEASPAREENITGLSMYISPKRQLEVFGRVLPRVKRILVLYDPAKTDYLVQESLVAAREIGLELVTQKIKEPREVPPFLHQYQDHVGAVWMLPDTTVIYPEAVEAFLLFSLERSVPVLTFSDKYLELGAFCSIGVDTIDLGRQAGEMAQQIIRGVKPGDIPPAPARRMNITLNRKIAKKLDILIPEQLIEQIGRVRIVN